MTTKGGYPPCPKCESLNVRHVTGMMTLACVVDYQDEDGHMHRHDPNEHMTMFECMKCRNRFDKTGKMPCPAPGCDYNKDPLAALAELGDIDDDDGGPEGGGSIRA